jgi:hypothetical protein
MNLEHGVFNPHPTPATTTPYKRHRGTPLYP